MNNSKSQYKDFSQKISDWYLSDGRDGLPWRKNISPYRIWISEIMLQQTQVKTVIPFFKRFISTYPNLKAIASASEDEILALWSGLGFYRRAKNIYKTKEIIRSDFKNRFPRRFIDLIKLPGIGRSTAGAIMSIAYKQSYPILDSNVKRVISRYKKVDLNKKNSIKKLWLLSDDLTPEEGIFNYTQGIMDLGATICQMKSADCINCPLNKTCKSAFKDLKINNKVRKKRSYKKVHFTLAHSNERFLLFKKNRKSFWESLWVPYDHEFNDVNNYFPESTKRKIKNINHLLSHIELDITIEVIDYKNPFKIKTNMEHQWIRKDQIHNYGMPKPIKTIIENYG